MPESMLTTEMKKADKETEFAEFNMEGSKFDEEVQE